MCDIVFISSIGGALLKINTTLIMATQRRRREFFFSDETWAIFPKNVFLKNLLLKDNNRNFIEIAHVRPEKKMEVENNSTFMVLHHPCHGLEIFIIS